MCSNTIDTFASLDQENGEDNESKDENVVCLSPFAVCSRRPMPWYWDDSSLEAAMESGFFFNFPHSTVSTVQYMWTVLCFDSHSRGIVTYYERSSSLTTSEGKTQELRREAVSVLLDTFAVLNGCVLLQKGVDLFPRKELNDRDQRCVLSAGSHHVRLCPLHQVLPTASDNLDGLLSDGLLGARVEVRTNCAHERTHAIDVIQLQSQDFDDHPQV